MCVGYVIASLCILYYIFVPHKNSFTTLGWKAMSSICFVLLGMYLCFQQPEEGYRRYLVIGLILGAIGDVLLALLYCYPTYEKHFFLGGLSAFLFGHIAYSLALCHSSVLVEGLFVSIALLGGATMMYLIGKKVDFQEMRIPVILYAAVILFMELQALTWLAHGVYGIVLNIGTICFVLSDLLLVFILFDNKDTRHMVQANLTFYYVAQMLILTTMLQPVK